MEGNLNFICVDYDLVELISMQAQFLCISASLLRACNFQAFPHSLRSVVPCRPGLHFHVSTVLIRRGEIALTPE